MTSDYGGLKAIIDEARELDREDAARPLVGCPVCGEPLDENSAGVKNCPYGHFTAPPGATQGSHGGVS